MRFWDSSAIITAVTPSARPSEPLAGMIQDGTGLAVWWATVVECASAAARLERQGGADALLVPEIRRRVALMERNWNEVPPSTPVRDRACNLLQRHSMRAADALQLAAALEAAGNGPGTLPFVCLDQRLRTAARAEGFPVVP